MSENLTSYELAGRAFDLLRALMDAGQVPAAQQADAEHLLGRWGEFRVFNGLADCPDCNARGIASEWVKCGTGAEENLDFPCHCKAGKLFEAEMQATGRRWVL